jgi:metal-sulfur cluster biosynthetic enzyme
VGGAAATRERLWRALREVRDPEKPVSIVDLGFVVDLAWDGTVARVALTFCSTGCPVVDWIARDVRERLLREEGVDQVVVAVVWDPPWSSERVSEAGREALRRWGIGV